MWKLFYIYFDVVFDVVKFLRRVIYKLRFVRFPYQPMHVWLFYDKFIVEKQFPHSKRRKSTGNISNFSSFI